MPDYKAKAQANKLISNFKKDKNDSIRSKDSAMKKSYGLKR